MDAQALVGHAGGAYVRTAFSTAQESIEAVLSSIQARGSLGDASCEPLLGLVDNLQYSRAETYQAMLGASLSQLRERIPSLAQPTLLKLLEARALTPTCSCVLTQPLQASFALVNLDELREVPFTVMEHLREVPQAYLAKLAADADLFRQLPPSIQRQAWELNTPLFRHHALPSILGYKDETATVMRELDMSCRLSAVSGQAGAAGAAPAAASMLGGAPAVLPQLLPHRRELRGASANVQRLLKLAGSSWGLFAELASLCRAQYAESGATALCSLRSQMHLAQYSSPHLDGRAELRNFHRLTFLLDLSVREGHCDQRRLAEMVTALESLEARVSRPMAGAREPESSKGAEDPAVVALADCAMILRDPPALHLLLHETIRALEGVVEREAVPKDEPHLVGLTKVLAYATGARELADSGRLPVPALQRDVLEKFYPLLADVMLEADLRDEGDTAGDGRADDKLVRLVAGDSIARKVSLAYLLQRVTVGDVVTAEPLLAAARDALTEDTLGDEGPFLASLARQLVALAFNRRLAPESRFWCVAMDCVLLRGAGVSMEVHEELLQLLLAVAAQLSPAHLAHCLETALHVSRRMRKHHKRRLGAEAEEMPARALRPSADMGGYSSPGSASDGSALAQHGKGAGNTLRSTYALFTKRDPRLTEALAPKLFAFLSAA